MDNAMIGFTMVMITISMLPLMLTGAVIDHYEGKRLTKELYNLKMKRRE